MPGGPSIDAGEVLHQLLGFIREQTAASGRSRCLATSAKYILDRSGLIAKKVREVKAFSP